MQGFTQKQDGLVNASDIAKTRVENPKDYLKRDQEVWVKVISTAGGRIRLSMRDVDQKSGKDLVPMGKAVEGKFHRHYILCILQPLNSSRYDWAAKNYFSLGSTTFVLTLLFKLTLRLCFTTGTSQRSGNPQRNLNMRMDRMTEILGHRGQQGICGPSGYPGPVRHQDHR